MLLFEFSDAGNRRGRGWRIQGAAGGVYFILVSRAFAPHARNNSGTTGGVELADMFPSVTWRKTPMEHRRRSQLQGWREAPATGRSGVTPTTS